ncbi:hypothetical protein SAMN05880580_10765 [Priestia flexa]|nr:hypothetical protein GA0061087_107217 [Priestia flexa]SIQ63577.1 hypothetical protein SAMN05880580_10765 [Priestia flexa]
MIPSQRRIVTVLNELSCQKAFVPLHYRHSLSAGRNLILLASLSDLSFSSSSRRSRVSYALFHSFFKLVFQVNKQLKYKKEITLHSSDISLNEILMYHPHFYEKCKCLQLKTYFVFLFFFGIMT